MAHLHNGIFGNLSGSIGSMTFVTRNGKTHVRQKSKPRPGSGTVKQEAQRAKFKLVSEFISTLRRLFAISFQASRTWPYGPAQAFSHIITEAIIGQHPNFQLDYETVLVSNGRLAPANADSVQSTEHETIDFTWTYNPSSNSSPNDNAILVVHCPSLSRSVYAVTEFERSSEFASIKVPFAGLEVHAWISFISVNEKCVARSEYAGKVRVAGNK